MKKDGEGRRDKRGETGKEREGKRRRTIREREGKRDEIKAAWDERRGRKG